MKVTAKLKKEIRAEIERMFGRKMQVEVGQIVSNENEWSFNQINWKDGEWDLLETTNLTLHKEWDDIDGEIWIDLFIWNRSYFGRDDNEEGLISNAYITIKDGAITHASLNPDLGWQRSTGGSSRIF